MARLRLPKPVIAIVALAFAALCPVALGATVDTALEAKVDAYFKPYVDTDCFNGVALVTRDGETVLAKAYGLADREAGKPMTLSTRFPMLGLSSVYTAAGAMKLSEMGKLDLQAPVSRYLPDFPLGGSITVHNLLCSNSALPDYNGMVATKALLGPGTPVEPQDVYSVIKGMKTVGKVGASPGSPNTEMYLLGLIIERVTGKPYGRFIREDVLEPLGLPGTVYGWNDCAKGYRIMTESGTVATPLPDEDYAYARGGLSATMEDAARFLTGLMSGGYLSRASLDAMFKEWNKGRGNGYGCVVENGGASVMVEEFQLIPGYSMTFRWFPKDRTVVGIACNIQASLTSIYRDDIGSMLAGKPYTVRQVPAIVPLDEKAMAPFPANYTCPFYKNTILMRNGKVYYQEPGGLTTELLPIGPTRFLMLPGFYILDFSLTNKGTAVMDNITPWGFTTRSQTVK